MISVPRFFAMPHPSPTSKPGAGDRRALVVNANAGPSGARSPSSAAAKNLSMSFTVDLKCGRTADDGRILIAGDTTESTSNFATTGTRTAIALKPGSPVVAAFEFEDPAAKAESCLAFLDAIMDRPNLATLGPDALEPIQGTVQLAP